MDDDPLKIAKAIKISRKCLGIVYQNIVFAIGVKLLCLLLGAVGLANMWLAIFADGRDDPRRAERDPRALREGPVKNRRASAKGLFLLRFSSPPENGEVEKIFPGTYNSKDKQRGKTTINTGFFTP